MDSLAANYASSDEDESDKDPIPSCNINSVTRAPSKSLFSSLPPPKSDMPSPPSSLSSSSFSALLPPPKSTSSPIGSSDLPTTSRAPSLFSSLPPPKTTSSSSASSIFSSLPPPKSVSEASKPKPTKPVPPNQPAKRVVQFTPPIHPSVFKSVEDDDDDDDDQNEVDKRRRNAEENLSSRPLSSIIPAPKNSHVLGSVSTGRRSLVETNVPIEKAEPPPQDAPQVDAAQADIFDSGSYYDKWPGASEVEGQGGLGEGEPIASTGLNPSYGVYYQSYGNYDGSWGYGTMEGAEVSEAPQVAEDIGRIAGKRGRNEIPVNIMEVNQDELVKDRPREDQTKATGIAFGPAYQPVSSQKGKPSKLHKRKHQIGSLFFDMKQKEMELTERRSRGMLTKRETQGKYGW